MYYDYNGNEIEDLEMDNMRRDAREEERERRMNRTFEVTSIQADDPESSYRVYYNAAQVKEQLPLLVPIITEEDFHSIKLVAGLNSLEVTVCCEEEDEEPVYDYEPDEYLFREDHPNQQGDNDPRNQEDELGTEAQQAMNAFQRRQAGEGTWQERERQADQERLAYCGYEEF